jgi:hypothetical protein
MYVLFNSIRKILLILFGRNLQISVRFLLLKFFLNLSSNTEKNVYPVRKPAVVDYIMLLC